jgi:hypothetical protein
MCMRMCVCICVCVCVCVCMCVCMHACMYVCCARSPRYLSDNLYPVLRTFPVRSETRGAEVGHHSQTAGGWLPLAPQRRDEMRPVARRCGEMSFLCFACVLFLLLFCSVLLLPFSLQNPFLTPRKTHVETYAKRTNPTCVLNRH